MKPVVFSTTKKRKTNIYNYTNITVNTEQVLRTGKLDK